MHAMKLLELLLLFLLVFIKNVKKNIISAACTSVHYADSTICGYIAHILTYACNCVLLYYCFNHIMYAQIF